MRRSRVPRRKMLLLDTSILLEILRIPAKSDRSETVTAQFEGFLQEGVALQIPMAAVLETGSHIRKINDGDARKRCAQTFTSFLKKSLSDHPPWKFAPFTWTEDVVHSILGGRDHGYSLRQSIGDRIFEIGDLTIIEEWRVAFKNINHKVYDVDVWTLDSTLRGIIDSLRTR